MSIRNSVITLLSLSAVTHASVFRQEVDLSAIPAVGALAEATTSDEGAVAAGKAAFQEALDSGASEDEAFSAAVKAEGAVGGGSTVEVEKGAGAAFGGDLDGMPSGSGGGGGDSGGDQGGQQNGDQGQQGGQQSSVQGQQDGGQGQAQSGQGSQGGGQENQGQGQGQGQDQGQNGQQSQNEPQAQPQDQGPEGRDGGQASSGGQGQGQNRQQSQNGQQAQPQDQGRDGSLESTDTTASTAPDSESALAGPSAPSATTSATTNSTAPTTSASTSVSRSSRKTLIDPLASPETLAEETEEGDDDDVCFPAHATVELRDGSIVRMEELSVGDQVRVSSDEFSEVFMFTHKLSDAKHSFVTLRTASGATISATNGHYIYANGQLAAAGTVRQGDVLTLANGQLDIVDSVRSESARGLFNPQTAHGSIVVNGVLASTYTTAVEPSFAHAILSPLRALNRFGLSFAALESGGGAMANVLPRGERLL